MKVQSNLLDKLVRFAGRNLPAESGPDKVELEIGKVIRINGHEGEFRVMSIMASTYPNEGTVVSLQLNEIVNGKVVR